MRPSVLHSNCRKKSAHLRRSGNVTPRETDVRRPSNVADPVGVAVKDVLLDPRLRVVAETPNLHEVVTACAREALHALHGRRGLAGDGVGRLGNEERPGLDGGCPGDGVAADGVGFEDVGTPLTIVYEGGI